MSAEATLAVAVLCWSTCHLANTPSFPQAFPRSWGGGIETCDSSWSLLFRFRWWRFVWISGLLQLQFLPVVASLGALC